MAFQIFIVEDHPAIRSAYTLLLQHESDLALCGTAASGEEALALIPHLQPDLVLVDLFLPGISGLTLIGHLYQMQPDLPILIVSGHDRTFNAICEAPVVLPNVKGFIHKSEASLLLMTMIRQVLAS